MKRKTKLTALCGLLTALSVVLMLPTFFIPIFTYVAPLFSGLVISVTQNVAGKKWGFGVYFAVGAISLILLSDKEAALTYIAFFGYYPLIKEPLERLKKPVAIFFKYLIFNAATVLSALVAIYVFTVPIEDYQSFGKLSVPILLLMANIVFVLYDLLLKRYKPLLDALMPKIEKYLR